MSVLKSKRKESKFEVFHHFYELRKSLIDLVLRNFNYKPVEDKPDPLADYILTDAKNIIINTLREINKHMTIANSIYPIFLWELNERRKHQDIALGLVYSVLQELQFILESIPSIDKNRYTQYALSLDVETKLIKGWRSSDNKIRNKIIKAIENGETIEIPENISSYDKNIIPEQKHPNIDISFLEDYIPKSNK